MPSAPGFEAVEDEHGGLLLVVTAQEHLPGGGIVEFSVPELGEVQQWVADRGVIEADQPGVTKGVEEGVSPAHVLAPARAGAQ